MGTTISQKSPFAATVFYYFCSRLPIPIVKNSLFFKRNAPT
jgi:hypothetical protein